MYYYFAQFHPDSDGKGGYSVVFPDLPGCHTCGDDLRESMEMAIDALTSFLEGSIADGEELPDPSDFETAKLKAQEYYRELQIPVRDDALYLLVPADPKMEPCVRLNISMQPRLLAQIDSSARAEGMTRSGFLAAAARNYMSQRARQG